ncbi:hypothetical protein SESBI_40665 [Sesbania bispinosa]|nr:hypothetical protein SESBI_40665 [Sesbania bispinosa]
MSTRVRVKWPKLFQEKAAPLHRGKTNLQQQKEKQASTTIHIVGKPSTRLAPPNVAPPTAANPTQIEVLKNAHNMTMYTHGITKVPMPPKLVEANDILHKLLEAAKNLCHSQNVTPTTANEEGGTQQSEVTSTNQKR